MIPRLNDPVAFSPCSIAKPLSAFAKPNTSLPENIRSNKVCLYLTIYSLFWLLDRKNNIRTCKRVKIPTVSGSSLFKNGLERTYIDVLLPETINELFSF